MKHSLAKWSLAAAILILGPGMGACADGMHAGPIYTSANESPVFPTMEVLIDVPPNTPIEMLRPGNFTIQIDGSAVEPVTQIKNLADAGHGVAAVVLFDASGSMQGGPLNAIRNGLGRFVNDAGPADKFALETIADDRRWDSDWGEGKEHAQAAIKSLASRGHLTRLWDGVMDALNRFPATPTARRILIISDGHDEGSTHTLQEVMAEAAKDGVVIDGLGLTRSDPRYLASLQQLAAATGGLFRQARNTQELETLVGSGIQRVKQIPLATFVASHVKADGQMHSFKVIWNHGGVVSSDTLMAGVPNAQVSTVTETTPERAHSNKKSLTDDKWFWWIIAAGVLLVAAIGVIVISMRQPQVSPVSVPGQAPVAGMPPPAAAPPPVAYNANAPPPAAAPVSSAPPAFKMNLGSASPASVARKAEQVPVMAEATPLPIAKPIRRPTQFAARFSEPSKGHPTAWLFCESGSEAGSVYPIDEREFWIGALENNHLQIKTDPTVSGNHACIAFDHDSLGIYDYRSTNGTRVNDEVVTEARRLLSPGDRIRIGTSVFVLRPVEDMPV